jgi:signal transduction histidine kinase
LNQRAPRILAIDDTPANLLTLGAALSADFDLQIATSGVEGIALAEANPPDLILLDVMMPEMDGYAVCTHLKADPRLRDVPIVFVTALSDSEAESRGLQLGAADYLTKPIKVDIARRRIRNLVERRQYEAELLRYRQHLESMVAERTLQLSIAKEEAESANRAKTAFLATMSHELRTPLNGIMGMAGLALRRASEPKQKEQLSRVLDAGERLLSMISNILEITKIEAERLTLASADFRLGDVLAKSQQSLTEQAANKGLACQVVFAPALADLVLRGDPQRLELVLGNLLGNAVKFTHDGEVVLQVTCSEEAGQFRLRFAVKDSGIGISPEDQARIFSLFEQVDSSMTRCFSGAGIGLPICRHLVALMGGEMGVESQPGQGSCFWFTVCLPSGNAANLTPA